MYPALKVGIIVGEPSGDTLGLGLIKALKKHNPNMQFEGIGGPKMLQEGFRSIIPLESITVMGITSVIMQYPKLWLLQKKIIRHFIQSPPDIFIGIDAPDYNLTIEKSLKERGIKIVHYVSPKVWAWRSKRIKKIKESIDLMLTLFPFEHEFYKLNGLKSCFIGHPLADEISMEVNTAACKEKLGFNPATKVIAVLPGSRACEMKYIGPFFIKIIKRLSLIIPDVQFVIPFPNLTLKKYFQDLLSQSKANINVQFVLNDSKSAIAASDIALVKAGTSTLETMLLKKPMVVVYKCGFINALILKKMVKVKFFSLPNLLADQGLVKEYFQEEAKEHRIVNDLVNLLEESQLSLKTEYYRIHSVLKKNASKKAAEAIINLLASHAGHSS